MTAAGKDDKLRRLNQSIRSGDFQSAEDLIRGVKKDKPPRPKRSAGPISGDDWDDFSPGAAVGDGPVEEIPLDEPPSPFEDVTAEPAASRPAQPMHLSDIPGGTELGEATPVGERVCWEILRPLGEALPEGSDVSTRFAATLRGAGQRFDELAASPALCHAADAKADDVLLLAAHALGEGEPVFLVGTLGMHEGCLCARQLLARTSGEEPAVLVALDRFCDDAGLLVSFHGPADLAALRRRGQVIGLGEPWTCPPHLDLLAECRRRWRKRIRSWTLPALERRLLRRRRARDIPPAEIPGAFRRYQDTGDASALADVLSGNLRDLAALADLLGLLLTGVDPLGQDA